MEFKATSVKMLEEEYGSRPFLMRLMYRLRVTSPIILTNYSGHIINAVLKRMLMSDDPLQYIVQITPLYAGGEGRYLLSSPIALQPGIYSFTATTRLHAPDKIVRLVDQTHVELEGVKCRLEQVEFQPIGLNTLRASGYPQYFYLIFRTPTIMGKKPTSMLANKKIYELLPTPTYVFGTLANTWNSVVGDDSLKIDIEKYLEWVKSHVIVIPPLRLMSYTVKLGGREISGFMGKVGYSSISPDSYEHYITVLLARLSHYTGTGLGRRLGFGVTIYQKGGMGSSDEGGSSS